MKAAYLTGNFAAGKDSNTIDLALIGDNLDQSYIDSLVEKTEKFINRKIKYDIMTRDELIQNFAGKPLLLIWNSDTENR